MDSIIFTGNKGPSNFNNSIQFITKFTNFFSKNKSHHMTVNHIN